MDKLLRDNIHEAKRIADRLRPLISDDHGITPGIEYVIDEIKSRHRPEIVLQVESEMDQSSEEMH